MTQRERIHQMLRAAGSRGIRSDDFFAAHMPRAAARIQELRDSGVEITSEREGRFVRYRLQEQRGVTRRSINQHAGREDNPINGGIARRPVRTGEPGDKSEVPAAAPEDVESAGVGAGTRVVPSGLGSEVTPNASADSGTPEGQLFQLPSRSAFTDSEWAA